MEFARFMASPFGRILRIVLGIALIWIGVLIDKPLGYVFEVVGLIPIIAGVMNWCFIAPLLGVPFRASDLDQPGA